MRAGSLFVNFYVFPFPMNPSPGKLSELFTSLLSLSQVLFVSGNAILVRSDSLDSAASSRILAILLTSRAGKDKRWRSSRQVCYEGSTEGSANLDWYLLYPWIWHLFHITSMEVYAILIHSHRHDVGGYSHSWCSMSTFTHRLFRPKLSS